MSSILAEVMSELETEALPMLPPFWSNRYGAVREEVAKIENRLATLEDEVAELRSRLNTVEQLLAPLRKKGVGELAKEARAERCPQQ